MLMSYIERGEDLRDCQQKITQKYQQPFNIVKQKEIRIGGFLGLFTRKGLEVEFYLTPILSRNSGLYQNYSSQSAEALDEQKKKVIAAAGRDPAHLNAANLTAARDSSRDSSQQILNELREIKEKMAAPASAKEEHPNLVRIGELLKANDFSDAYIAKMTEKARGELPLETLDNFAAVQDRVLEWVGESISIYNEPEIKSRLALHGEGRIIALVGPTGVGKTTTIAKLAAIYGIDTDNSGISPLSVRMITIDAFRIGARAQIESYGNIMGIPVSYVDERRDLRKEIALHRDETDLILIDTIGKSPKDSVKLGEMKEFLDVLGSGAEVHLVLSAITKSSDISNIIRQFEPFNYQSVILSKIDETNHIGNIISALAERGKSVSYITDGQKVPDDIKKASVIRFLINLEGFKVDRDKMEKRFPLNVTQYSKWS